MDKLDHSEDKSIGVEVTEHPHTAKEKDSYEDDNEDSDPMEYDSLEQPDDSITQEVVRS